MNLPPPFKPKHKQEPTDEQQPASPSSPTMKKGLGADLEPMDALPHTDDVEGYLAHKAQQDIMDPTAKAT